MLRKNRGDQMPTQVKRSRPGERQVAEVRGTPTLKTRASGLLLHPTSLPGRFGIGDLGPAAYAFADFLADSGQSWWQMLPIVPPGDGNSPYMSPSAFAASPLLISLERLCDEGLLSPVEIANPARNLTEQRVNYAAVERYKTPRFRKAFAAFEKQTDTKSRDRFEEFCAAHHDWLMDYAHFCALKRATADANWVDWEKDIRTRKTVALKRSRDELRTEIQYKMFLQYQLSRQWSAVKEYCADRRIGLIGDVPIFVAHDSADVWAHPQLFQLRKTGHPTVVAGVPPDYFCEDGQLWGNPHYAWSVHRARGYDWWVSRLRACFERFDAVRLDHFIGFQRSWQVDAGAKTARVGRWANGPAADFFKGVRAGLGQLELIAEDLGTLTPEVGQLRDEFELPGMRVLQFAFGLDPNCEIYQPHSYSRECVVYTGTHDNDTTVGWFADRGSSASTRSRQEIEDERAFTLRYLGSDGREIHWDMIRLALLSVANTAIFPVQDVLGLGSEARMNKPGTGKANWEWRLAPGALTGDLAERLGLLTETYGRNPRSRRADLV